MASEYQLNKKGKTMPVINELNDYTPRHESVWGSRGIYSQLLTSALDREEWSASRHRRLIPPKQSLIHICS
jgi:hypothetical protein